MFIYSNHYLIVSRLTREDFKDYFNFYKYPLGMDFSLYESKANNFSEIEETDYYFHEFIDLGIYYFEHNDFVKIEKDPKLESFWVQKVCVQEYDQEDRLGRTLVINDMSYHSTGVIEPLMHNHHWVRGGIYYIDKNATPDEQEKQKFHVVQDLNSYVTPFKEESIKFRLFPRNQEDAYYLNESHDFIKDNDTTMRDVVIIGEYKFEKRTEIMEVFCYYTNTDNAITEVWFYSEEAQDGDLNHIISVDMCIDDDSPEYWHEPIFIFPIIREIDCFRPIFTVEPKNIFDRFYTSPLNNEWHENSEFDRCLGRNTIC